MTSKDSETNIKQMFQIAKLMDLLNEKYHLTKLLYEKKFNKPYPVPHEVFIENFIKGLKFWNMQKSKERSFAAL